MFERMRKRDEDEQPICLSTVNLAINYLRIEIKPKNKERLSSLAVSSSTTDLLCK